MAGLLGKVAVVGAGAVGSYYGARLARAGEKVAFLMRRDRAGALAHGLGVRVFAHREKLEEWRLQPLAAFASTEEIGPVDWVIVALKATADGAMRSLLAPLIGEHTSVLTLQNGLGSDEHAAREFGSERVVGGLCFVCLNRVVDAGGAPAVECYHPGSVCVGELGRLPGERAQRVAEAFRRAGVKCAVADNLAEARWRKLVWNVPFNGLSIAAGSVTTDRILADPALRSETEALMREVQAAAAAQGMAIGDEFLRRQVEVTAPMGAYKPSSLIDYLEGRAVEVEAIWGEPLRRARAAGVATPHLERLHARLIEMCGTRRPAP